MAIVYCSEKLDGVAAAAIIIRHALLRKANIRFGGYLRHNTLTQQLKEMPQEAIFIAGICPNEKHLPLIEEKNITYWSTHDPNAPEIKAKLVDKTNEKKCSAELTQQRFMPNDTIAQKLARLAHEIVFWQKSEESEKLADLIASGYNPNEIVTSLARGVTWSPKFEQLRNEYLKQKKEAYERMLKTLTIKKYLTCNFGFAKTSLKLASADACQKILDVHKGIDVSVTIYKDGSIFFRRRNDCPINMRKLAQLFDGGGKEYASGAHVSNYKTYEQTLNQIDQKIKKHIIDNSNV